jgi:hypothetical protein
MIKNFLDFKQSYKGQRLDENINQAKTFLRNRALRDKKEKMSPKEGENVGLTPEEVRRADNDPSFQTIKSILRDNEGLVYTFTKFFFEDLADLSEEDRFSELKNLVDKLKRLRSSLSNLPMPIDRYVSKAANDEEKKSSEEEGRQFRPAIERLIDDLGSLEEGVSYNKWVQQLLSWQKAWLEKMTPFQKEKIVAIAKAFDEYGTDKSGKKDPIKNKKLQDFFFSSVKQYQNLNSLIQAAEANIQAVNNSGFEDFIVAIENVNKQYGLSNGAEQVYLKDNILILEVRSYAANKDLNANTRHCIAKSIGSWEFYVGEEKFTKQFYIYNFKLPSTDNMSVIGVTIGESYRITACHLKNDENHASKIIDTLKKWSIPKEAMQPMTKEEIEARKRRIEASKQIIKENLPIVDIEKYLEAGANPNAQNGKPLENAVRENNKQKVELLIKKGAVPTLNNPIKFAKDLDMIKILVKNGCELTNEILNTIINDLDAMKFVLQNGIDANFEKGYPLRAASRNQNLDVVKLLVTHGANVAERRYMVVKQCIEYGTNEILKYLLDELESGDANFKNPVAKQKLFAEWIGWCSTSLQTTPEQKEEVVEILKSYE